MKLTVTRVETENTMKITVELDKPKASSESFEKVCILIGIFIVGSGILKFFSMFF